MGALEAAADQHGRPVQTLVHEAIASWLADAASDDADHAAIEQARAEAAEQGGRRTRNSVVEFEAFFPPHRPTS